jgi:hypothetical protein
LRRDEKGMSKSIRVRMDLDESEFKEVSIEEAKKLVADACARRMVVLNKKTKHIIREITEDVEEIIIISILDGG